jgi:hypothetical protein
MDEVARQTRLALDRIRTNSPTRDDRARAKRLVEMMDWAAPGEPTPAKIEEPSPPTQAASEPIKWKEGEPRETNWMLVGLGLVVAIAIAFAIIGSR